MGTRHRFRIILVLLLSAGAWLLAGSSAPAADMDPRQDLLLGREAAHYLKKTAPISRNQAMQDRVQRIGQALVERMDKKLFPYEFTVLANPEINACAFPGGFIFVHEGLINRLPDDNALAAVLAHEITHAAQRHWANTKEKMQIVSFFSILGSLAIGDYEGRLASLVMQLTNLKYSRTDEYEADKIGLTLAWQAGYDPVGGIKLTELLAEVEKGNRTPTYARTHPKARDRAKKLEELRKELATRTRPASPGAAPPPLPALLGESVGSLGELVPAANAWFPLAVGNRWEYVVESRDGKTQYTVSVAGAIPTDRGTVYRLETRFTANTTMNQALTTADGLWRRSIAAGAPWRLDFPLAMPANEVTIEDATYRDLGAEELLLPCGKFTNVRHLCKSTGTATVDLWFAEGVGLLKRAGAETGVTETLSRFTLKPAEPAPAPDEHAGEAHE